MSNQTIGLKITTHFRHGNFPLLCPVCPTLCPHFFDALPVNLCFYSQFLFLLILQRVVARLVLCTINLVSVLFGKDPIY